MYILILEEGDLRRSDVFTDEDRAMCDDGILDVIDIGGNTPKQYFNDAWHEIDIV